MNARDYLTSSDSDLVIARCVAFTVLWICVRWVASNVVFSNVEPALRVRQGTKSVIVVHSAFQAIAAVWLVRIKYGKAIAGDDPIVIKCFKTQMNTCLAFAVMNTGNSPLLIPTLIMEGSGNNCSSGELRCALL